ncbi:carbonic anhydrase family protein [Chryseobacterium sp. MMS23-Vi53]|uniref:carbonic anhydrase family protein n=1 Tax=Chryseobacterium sp. MMS23-Vi53 TaxID=3386644 RepID=UPI0039E85EEF
MVKEGEENSYFEKLNVFKSLAKNGKEDTNITFNPEKMYPKNKSYYQYSGSLTTPPCSDNVTWIVFKNPINMSENEIKDIAKHLPKNNNRPIQPLNDRKILISKQQKLRFFK